MRVTVCSLFPIVLQGEVPTCDDIVVKLIGFDGNITEKKLGQSTVHLPGVRQKTKYHSCLI